MKNEIIIKRCDECGAILNVLKDCECSDCGLMCCGKRMEQLIPITVECSVEKHLPTYERVEDEIFVRVNHVMEKEHYIEWIALVSETKNEIIKLYPEQNAETRFK